MTISVEEGYRRARAQRPGRRIVMGPEAARDLPVRPLSRRDIAALPGPASWLERDCGHPISLWVLAFAQAHAALHGRKTTPDDVAPFMDPALSLTGARAIIARLAQEQSDQAA